ncbi:hypothetical protein MHYP_G00114210 [Metynnis hypsauchen]
MAVVRPPPRRTGAFITFAMVKFASLLPEHLQDLQATEHQGAARAASVRAGGKCPLDPSICHGFQGHPPHESQKHEDICPNRQRIRMRRPLSVSMLHWAQPHAFASIRHARSRQIAFFSEVGVSYSSLAAAPLADNLIRLVIMVLLDPDKCV